VTIKEKFAIKSFT